MGRSQGTPITVGGGYDFEPEWLAGREQVTGHVEKWIPGHNTQAACETEPEDKAWAGREVGAGVESHATYSFTET